MNRLVITFIDDTKETLSLEPGQRLRANFFKYNKKDTTLAMKNYMSPYNKLSFFTKSKISKLEFVDEKDHIYRTINKEDIASLSYGIEKDSDSLMFETINIVFKEMD